MRFALQVEASFAALTSGDDKALLTRIREIKGLKQPGPQVMSPPHTSHPLLRKHTALIDLSEPGISGLSILKKPTSGLGGAKRQNLY